MYLIGIDIAKYKHDCFIMLNSGEVVKNSFSFDNSAEGFKSLLSILVSLDHSKQIKIGLEATGHYGNNLKAFLNEHNYSFMEFNPYLVSKFSQAKSMRRTKTDKIDAMMIAKFLSDPDLTYKPYSLSSYHIYSLKSLSRLRESLIKQRSLHLVQLTNIMDKVFPEFKPLFNGKFGTTALYILKKYKSPARISKLTDVEISKLKKLSRKISAAKFVKLRELAKNSIGTSDDYLLFQLNSILTIFFTVDAEVANIDNEIHSIMSCYNEFITSIPGISISSAAVIIGEYGDMTRFDGPAAMLAYAGLEPSTIQSGTQEFKGKMVKRGSSHLRYTLMNIAMTVIKHNPTFYSYYYKKHYSESKHHRVALSHVVRKLIRVIYHLQIMHKSFDASLLK